MPIPATATAVAIERSPRLCMMGSFLVIGTARAPMKGAEPDCSCPSYLPPGWVIEQLADIPS